MSRLFPVEVGGSISPSGRLVAQRETADGTEAIRVADRQKRSLATDLDANGILSYTIDGPSPKGEAGHSLKSVVTDFRKRHSLTVRALGFKAV